MEGLPRVILEKLLLEEKEKREALPTDDRTKGVLRIPENLSAPMLAGDAQRNVPAILLMLAKEAKEIEKRKQLAFMNEGEGLSLPLSKGIMTGTMEQRMSFLSIFGRE